MEISVYEHDKFDAMEYFNCMPIEYARISKEHFVNAVKFSKKQYRLQQAEPLRQNLEEGDIPKRDKQTNSRWIMYLSVDEMKQYKWFQSILQEVEGTLKSIHASLCVKKFAILKAIDGCPRQIFHYDNSAKSPKKRYSLIFSIMDGTSMVFKDPDGNLKFPWSVDLSPGSAVCFNDFTLHAGASYNRLNYRFFFAASPEEDDEEETSNNIHVVPDNNEKSWTCQYCGHKARIDADTTDRGRSNENKHKKICVQSLMKRKNMDEKSASAEAEAELKIRRERSKICMTRKRKKERDAKEKSLK